MAKPEAMAVRVQLNSLFVLGLLPGCCIRATFPMLTFRRHSNFTSVRMVGYKTPRSTMLDRKSVKSGSKEVALAIYHAIPGSPV